jgi:hypothetical protein
MLAGKPMAKGNWAPEVVWLPFGRSCLFSLDSFILTQNNACLPVAACLRVKSVKSGICSVNAANAKDLSSLLPPIGEKVTLNIGQAVFNEGRADPNRCLMGHGPALKSMPINFWRHALSRMWMVTVQSLLVTC